MSETHEMDAERAEVIAAAIQMGIKIDKRLSTDKLRHAVSQAREAQFAPAAAAGDGPTIEQQDEEHAALWKQATQLGIGGAISPKGNSDALREHIQRHMAAKAQAQDIQRELDARRARAAPVEKVTLRVLPLGDQKISKGIHIPGIGDIRYARGDLIEGMPLHIARVHEKNGVGEIISGAA